MIADVLYIFGYYGNYFRGTPRLTEFHAYLEKLKIVFEEHDYNYVCAFYIIDSLLEEIIYFFDSWCSDDVFC